MAGVPAGSAAAVSTRGLSVRYGRTTALDGVDVSLPRGAVTALVGPNGSGKSSLLLAACGLVPVASGEISVLGRPARAGRPDVAVVLQATPSEAALPVTAREVVRMARYARRGPLRRLTAADAEAVDSAMERLEVTDLASRHLRELSGGQRQRVLVAQGLAQEADLLLLDEPVTGLDLVSADRILRVLADERAAGRTVVVCTHDLDDAEEADHVVLLAGVVVAAGPPGEVVTEANLRLAYGGRRLSGAGLRARHDEHGHD